MKQYQIDVGYVIEINRSDYCDINELLVLLLKYEIDYIPKLSDLEWDILCFCFNKKY